MEHNLPIKFTLIQADLNFLRGEYESETEWKLRRKFLELNYGLSLKRLNCLSHCFVNVALYGCSYPWSVMTEVHRRGASLLDEGSERMKEARQTYASSLKKAPGASSMNVLDDGCIKDPEVDLQVKSRCGAQNSKKLCVYAQTSKTQFDTAQTSKTQCDTAQTSKTQSDTTQSSKTQFDTAQSAKTQFDTTQTSKTQFGTAQTSKKKTSKTTPANCRYNTRQSKRLRDTQQEAQTSEILSNNFHDEMQIPDTVVVDINRGSQNSKTSVVCIRAKVPGATILGQREIRTLSQTEQNPILKKMRMVAFEVLNLSQYPKGADKRFKHAGKCLQVNVEFKFEEIPIRKGRTDIMCHVFVDGVKVAHHKGRGTKKASVKACKAALKIISMPEIEVCQEALEDGLVAETEQKCSESFEKSSSNCETSTMKSSTSINEDRSFQETLTLKSFDSINEDHSFQQTSTLKSSDSKNGGRSFQEIGCFSSAATQCEKNPLQAARQVPVNETELPGRSQATEHSGSCLGFETSLGNLGKASNVLDLKGSASTSGVHRLREPQQRRQRPASTCDRNIDSLRGEFESSKEWRLRKKFLETNFHNLSLDRLHSLSQCFVNIALYGCSYPWDVTKDVHRLSAKILGEGTSEKKIEARLKYAVSFVKASKTPEESSLDVVMDDDSVDEPKTFEEDISTLENNSKTASVNNGYNTQVTNTISNNRCVTKVIKKAFFRLICTNPNKNLALSQQECLIASNNEEFDHNVQKIRKLSYEVMKLHATSLPAEKKVRRAASCVPVNIDIKLEHLPQDRPNVHVCHVLVDDIIVVSSRGKKKSVFKSAIKVIRMRDIEIVEDGPGVGSIARGKGKSKKNVGRRLPGGLLSGEVGNHEIKDRICLVEGVRQPVVMGSLHIEDEGKTSEELVSSVKEEGKTSDELVGSVKEEGKTSEEVVGSVKEEGKTSEEVMGSVKEEGKTPEEVVGSVKEEWRTCLLSSVQSEKNSSKTVLSTTHIDPRLPVLSTIHIDPRPPVLSTTHIDQRPPVLSSTHIDQRPPVSSSKHINQRPPVLSSTRIDQNPIVLSSAHSDKTQTAKKTEMDTGSFLAPTSVTNQRYRARKVKRSLSIEECLIAYQTEKDPTLKKIRKLACEALNQAIKGKNAKNKLKAACNRVPVLLEHKLENVSCNTVSNFLHRVFLDGIEVASKFDSDKKKCRKWACEAAIQTIMMPKLEIVQSSNNIWQLKGSFLFPEDNFQPSEERVTLLNSPEECPESEELLPTTADSVYNEFKKSVCNGDQPVLLEELDNIDQDMPTYTGKFHCGSSKGTSQIVRLSRQHTLPNPKIKIIVLDSTQDRFKFLDKFVIVEKVGSAKEGAEKILRKSCIFNGVLLDYEFFPQGDSTRCVAKINDEVFADVCNSSKSAATATASVQCLKILRSFCWTLRTKQMVDSHSTVSREDVQNVPVKSDQIGSDNIGSKLLQKMGWSGGGIGKKGQGISEPISIMRSSNRQGLGFGIVPGKNDDFKKRLQEFVRNYCFSEKQEDLVFSREFNSDELRVVRNECWRMGLQSLYGGKYHKKYLCVSRKRTAEQLFEYVKGCGGETVKYRLVPPETEDRAACSEGLGDCSGNVE